MKRRQPTSGGFEPGRLARLPGLALFAFLGALLAGATPLPAAEGEAGAVLPPIVRLSVEPAEVALRGDSRQQQLQVTGELADGTRVDVTHHCRIAVSDPAIARVEQATVIGLADGDAAIELEAGTARGRVSLSARLCPLSGGAFCQRRGADFVEAGLQ